MKNRIWVFLLISVLCLSCFDPPVTGPTAKIGFYFLKDSTLSDMDSLNAAINELELADEPWLSEEDIDYYEWSGHYIYLNKSKRELLPDFFGGDSSFGYPRPFVVTVDSVRCYLGCFQNFILSWGNYYPSMTEVEVFEYPDDILSYFYWPFHDEDLRADDLLKSALQQNDQYRGGLEARIDTSYGAHVALSNDTTYLSYRLILQNNNDEALYVLDPEKCGTDVFYYLFGMPALSGLTTDCDWAFDLGFGVTIPDTSDFANVSYYSRIPAGDSLSFSLTIHGEQLEPDSYIMWNYIASFITGMNKEKRTLGDGSIWIGWTWMPLYLLEYDGGDRGSFILIDDVNTLAKSVNDLQQPPLIHHQLNPYLPLK